MSLARFYLPASSWSEPELVLSGEEARHCSQVTRHVVGDCVVLFDGLGRQAEARIVAASKEVIRLESLKTTLVLEPEAAVTLVQAIVKGDTMEWVIEKAVELGVRRVVPLIAQRSIVRLNAAEALKKRDKWQRVALEACKQCGQTWLPEITMPCYLPQSLELTQACTGKLISSLQSDAVGLREALPGAATTAALAIGPEGDFTAEEYQAFQQAGWKPWSLGPLTLRSETAAICALSILRYELASH
jgi:16S rRNA (uracil1498-N3)-methyltransferase